MADHPSVDSRISGAFEPAFTIERELEGGGMSRVFVAIERALNRTVVIKVLPPDLAAGVNRERFRREIQLAAQLQHPHIVPLLSAGEHDDLLYYTMPFIEGESLKGALRAGTRFAPREVAGILHDVVDALAYAHARGVIHRDIKPGNVLRSGRHAVVTDFGVAKAISAALPEVGTTASGMAIGTPAYMAPEQLAGDPAADHRVDLYAVGLLAYELLTGESPFLEASPQATMAAQLTRDPEPIARRRPDVPEALSSLVMWCLAKAPERRPQNAGELLARLDAIAFPSGDYLPPRIAQRTRQVAWVAAALVLVVLLVVRWSRDRAMVTAMQADSAGRAAATTESAAAPRPTPVVTRADSLAIAAAVAKQLGSSPGSAAPRPTPGGGPTLARLTDSLAGVIERKIYDSLAVGARQLSEPEAQRTLRDLSTTFAIGMSGARGTAPSGRRNPPELMRGIDPQLDSLRTLPWFNTAQQTRYNNLGPSRRLVLIERPGRSELPELTAIGHQVADTLRNALQHTRRWLVVPTDSVTAALQHARTYESIGEALHAEVILYLRVRPVGTDSAAYVVYVHDLGAMRPLNQRTATMPTVAIAQPLAGINRLVAATMQSVFAMDRAPRQSEAATAAAAPAADAVRKP